MYAQVPSRLAVQGFSTVVADIRITSRQCDTSKRYILLAVYNITNGCSHTYKFCLKFCSLLRLKQQLGVPGRSKVRTKQHKAFLFYTGPRQMCDVDY
jgi:hypothetical protein